MLGKEKKNSTLLLQITLSFSLTLFNSNDTWWFHKSPLPHEIKRCILFSVTFHVKNEKENQCELIHAKVYNEFSVW